MSTLDCLIPAPQKVIPASGQLAAHALQKLFIAPEFADLDTEIVELFDYFTLPCPEKADEKSANLKLIYTQLPAEAYSITVSNSAITLQAGSRSGMRYAVNSLQQIFFAACIKGSDCALFDCGTIEDAPRFAFRSLHLDSARHFQSTAVIKQYLRLMSIFKLNTFHWHLVDSQGWRLQLAATAGLENIYSVTPGFYTSDEISEIRALAAQLDIAIIPEIDVPGHSRGTLKFFPQYACSGAGNPSEFCLGNPQSEVFIKNILAEVMQLFPESLYIHIGGDEASTANWEKCPVCQAALQQKNLQTMRELENDFMNRIGQFVLDNDRTPILWGTSSGQFYPAEMVIQCWLDIREPVRAAANGNNIIYSVHNSLYLDYPANLSEPWETWMFELSEKGVYMCDPYIIWPDKVAHALLGTEACLWTETVPQWRVMQKVLPRMYAYSEAAWSLPENKDYNCFAQRKELLEAAGYAQKLYSL